MVLRFWGARGVDAESFAHLVDERAGGISTTSLLREIDARGWTAAAVPGSEARLADEINRNGRPVLALIEDRPGAFHYVVVVGVPERGVIFHDPARSSYRVMPRDQFAARWRASQRWMAVVTPRVAATPEPAIVTVAAGASAVAGSPCETLVAEGVRQSQAGDFAGAERTLTSALACPGGAAYRELAGLRVLQKRWNDAADLADTATQADAGDAHAWRLLATARFLQDDRPGSLAALNQAGEPAIDSVQVTGLERTRAEVIEDAIELDSGELLTPGALERARRRLKEVPAIRATALEFVPVSGGRAEVRATVTERRLFPTAWPNWARSPSGRFSMQDPRAAIGSMTGSGERLDVQYRFRRGRPRLGATLSAPAPWGGVWSVQGTLGAPAVRLTGGRDVGAHHRPRHLDRLDERAFPGVGARRLRSLAGHRLARHGGRNGVCHVARRPHVDPSRRGHLDGRLGVQQREDDREIQSSNRREGLVFVGSGGAGIASDNLPLESWFAGDSGNARPGPVLLRAHGLMQDNRYFRTDQMGRTIVHGSGEGQYLVPPPGSSAAAKPADPKPADVKPTGVGGLVGPGGIAGLRESLRIGVAVFVDSARVTRRLSPGDRNDVDFGVGLRLGLGGRGSVRADYGRGLLNVDNKFSFGYEL